MQSRYLGSDSLSQRQLQAQQDASQANELAVGRIAKATDSTVQGLVEGQRQVGQMQVAYATAQAQAANNSPLSGLSELVKTGTEAYMRYDSNEQRKAQEQAQAQQAAAKEQARLAKEQAEEQSEREYVQALEAVGNITQKYVSGNWDEGTYNYKSETTKAIAKFPNLSSKHLATLVDRIYNTTLTREDEARKGREEAVERQMNANAAQSKDQLDLELTPDIVRLKNLPPTEQAKPLLDNLNERIENYLKLNNGLSFVQKMEVIAKVTPRITQAFEGKAEAYQEWRRSMQARADYAVGYQKLYAEFQQDRDLSKFEDGKLLLKINTGRDYSEYMVAPGEAEKLALEMGNTLEGIYKLGEVRRERTGVQFQFADNDVRTATALMVVNPEAQLKLENNPILSKNPGIRAAIANANAIRKAREDQAALGVTNAKTQQEIAAFDITNVNNFSSVTRALINAQRNGTQPNAEQQYFGNVLAKANEATGGGLSEAVTIIQNAGSRALTKEEVQMIQQTLNNQAAAINNAKQLAIQEYGAKVNEFNTKHEAVLKQFGGRIPSDAELVELYNQGAPAWEQTKQRLTQEIEASGASAVPAYGQQSNFNQAGQGLGAAVSPDGKVRYAPRTSVHVQTKAADGGQPFVTPIAAANPANHSFNKGMYGGGYRAGRPGGRAHAGIDFPLREGQKAVTVVSGRVAFVGTAKGYGNYIDIMGDNGYIYRYSHSRALVRQGERVQPGQPVATPNLSGTNVGGAHLHYEVRKGTSYRPSATFGLQDTVDPVAHLRSLTPLAGSVADAPDLAGQSVGAVSRQLPWARTTTKAVFTPGAGALQANLFQQVGKPTQNAGKVFTAQRPLLKGVVSAYTGGQKPINNPRESYGYSWIAQRPAFAAKLAEVASDLGVPASWIADIMRQETGDNFALANGFHGNSRGENANRNYGLFGFGSDSGVPNYTRLNEVQQLEAYRTYMVKNGWLKHYKRTNGNVSIGQLWAMTKMGTKWRQDILNGRDPATMVDRTGKSQLEQFQMLGKWAGRQYDFGRGSQSSRSQRNRAVGRRASSVVDQALAANNSPDVQYRTTTV